MLAWLLMLAWAVAGFAYPVHVELMCPVDCADTTSVQVPVGARLRAKETVQHTS